MVTSIYGLHGHFNNRYFTLQEYLLFSFISLHCLVPFYTVQLFNPFLTVPQISFNFVHLINCLYSTLT